MEKNIILNTTLENYRKKYHNYNSRLLKYRKKDVEEFDKKYQVNEPNFLLKGHKWALIEDVYYEIPKAPRWVWFRNLNSNIQGLTCLLLAGGVSCAVIFPSLYATIWKPITIDIPVETKEYVDIKINNNIEVGKPLTTEITLKDSAKEMKQLPSKLKVVKTGDVILNEYKPTSTSYTSNISFKTINEEPENYYTYSLVSKEKANLYIKKILGPVHIELDVENIKFKVTFDPNNGEEKFSVDVVKKEKVNKPTNPTKKLCDFYYWSLDDRNETFDFDTPIVGDITLKAHYRANETGVIIKGINGLADHYTTMQEAYDAGNAIMKSLNADLCWGTCTKEKYLETFNDVTLDENGFYKANITWELYTKDGEELVIPSNRNEFFYSFGRITNSFGEGDNEKLFLYHTNIVGVTENKPKLKYEASNINCRIMTANTQHTTKTLENPFTFKNISFDDSLVDTYLILQTASPMDYYLTVDNCDFINRLCVDGTNKHIVIKNCVFDGAKSPNAYGLEFWSGNGAEKSDSLIFENNTVKNYKRGIQLNCSTLGSCSVKNNTFKDLNLVKDKLSNGAVQLSAGTNSTFDIIANTFDNCATNCFKIHENFIDHATVNINDNIIKNCGYVGLSENDKTLGYYTLNSANNEIINTAKDKAGFDKTTETTDIRYIVVLNEK